MNVLNSPNRTPGRGGVRIDRIVYHHTGGAFQPSLAWTLNPQSQVSYHYMIDRAGSIWRTVAEHDTAWHAGTWAMNQRSIGICGETGGWTPQARDSFVALTRELCGRYGLPINRSTVLAHRQVMQTACPGELPIDDWVRLAAQGIGAPTTPGGNFMAALTDEQQVQLFNEVQTIFRWIQAGALLQIPGGALTPAQQKQLFDMVQVIFRRGESQQ